MKNYLSISKAAEFLGISEQTLRRWDQEGKLKPTYVSTGGHRYYSIGDLERQSRGLFQVAFEWSSSDTPSQPPEEFFCETSDVFKTRLERMAIELERNDALREIGPLIASAAGEIGNNSFDHNLGNWPDVRGAFFAYDLGKRVVVLADRGRGILTTLRNVRPELKNDAEALKVAFTEIITGRPSEHRGNGLKYVRMVIEGYGLQMKYQSGDSILEVGKNTDGLKITPTNKPIRGSLCLIKF